jgi:hypothetical protein
VTVVFPVGLLPDYENEWVIALYYLSVGILNTKPTWCQGRMVNVVVLSNRGSFFLYTILEKYLLDLSQVGVAPRRGPVY